MKFLDNILERRIDQLQKDYSKHIDYIIADDKPVEDKQRRMKFIFRQATERGYYDYECLGLQIVLRVMQIVVWLLLGYAFWGLLHFYMSKLIK